MLPEVTDNVTLCMDFLKKMNTTLMCGGMRFRCNIGEIEEQTGVNGTRQGGGDAEGTEEENKGDNSYR